MSLSNYPTTRPSLILDFQKSEVVDPRVTFTRASSATRYNSYGVLETVGTDIPRIDFNPSTLVSQGLLIEEQRTNSIRNNTMVGAVAGTPGTLPTNWGSGTNASGLAWSVVGTGTEGGITYIDLRLSGTATSATEAFVFFESTTGVGASNGQTWTNSSYLYRVSGSATNITSLFCRTSSRITGGAAGSWVVNGTSVLTAANSSTSLSTVRATVAGTVSDASALYVWPLLVVAHNAGAIDITLRIGMPQLELGAFATSVIPTSTVAVTRSADVASMTGTNFSSWYNAVEGTIFGAVDASFSTTTNYPTICNAYTDSSNYIMLNSRGGASPNGRFEVNNGGASQAALNNGSVASSTAYKLVGAYAANNFALSTNNTTASTDASGSIPTVTTLSIGSDRSTTGWLNGHIQRLSYYPTRLANAQLQALTAT